MFLPGARGAIRDSTAAEVSLLSSSDFTIVPQLQVTTKASPVQLQGFAIKAQQNVEKTHEKGHRQKKDKKFINLFACSQKLYTLLRLFVYVDRSIHCKAQLMKISSKWWDYWFIRLSKNQNATHEIKLHLPFKRKESTILCYQMSTRSQLLLKKGSKLANHGGWKM